MDCTKCLAYNANIGIDLDLQWGEGARYGELTLLSMHACSTVLGEGNTTTTSCCRRYDENPYQCGLFFDDEFIHSCAYCGGENISEIEFPKAEHCTTCKKYYPSAGIDDPKGEISSLTGHACSYYGSYDNDISNCCLYDETTESCGVFENEYFSGGEFLYPCVCGDGIETGKKVGLGIGITAGVLFLTIVCWWYIRKRSRKIPTNEHNNAENELPTPVQLPSVTIPIDDMLNTVAVPVEVTQVLYAEVVDVKVNDGIPSAPELPKPIPAPAVARATKQDRNELASLSSDFPPYVSIPAPAVARSKKQDRNELASLSSERLKSWSIPRYPADAAFPLYVSPRDAINLLVEGIGTSCSIDMSNPSDTSYYAYELAIPRSGRYLFEPNMGILPPGESESIRMTLRPLFCTSGKDFLNSSELKVKIRACAVHASSAEDFLHMASSIPVEDTLNRNASNEAMWRKVIQVATKARDVHELLIPLRHI